MAGVALIDKDNYDGKITGSVILTCIMAASGGLIFGYDIGISGNLLTYIYTFFFFFFLLCLLELLFVCLLRRT